MQILLLQRRGMRGEQLQVTVCKKRKIDLFAVCLSFVKGRLKASFINLGCQTVNRWFEIIAYGALPLQKKL